ncbi:MAG: NADH-quinone oxidoreductase subunit C [Actinobacteria bacterium]|nr:NADH-quinone oxidoreductase subunit C [Actinomycetota bacterium]
MIALSAWREACLGALDRGGRFCGAYASGTGAARRWNALFADGAETLVLSADAGAADPPTIVDLIPAADWDEREAHDLRDLRFEGRESQRPLATHAPETASWTVPVEGRGTHQVVVGPTHAGVIESGHFRFHVVGERILQLDTRLFYKHRGLERAAEGRSPAAGLAFAARACGAGSVTNSVAYAQACEAALGLVPSRELRRGRTVLLELERLYNHLNDVAAICAGVGFAPGNMAFATLKERALRLNCELAGHRFLFGTVAVGGSVLDLDAAAAGRARGELGELRADAEAAWRELAFAASFQARLGGVGVLSTEDASELGAVGPAARASGLHIDTRGTSPGLWYGSAFAPARPPAASGDVAARLEMRAAELPVTFELLDDLLSEPVRPGDAAAGGSTGPIGVARVEGPRGETVCAVELEGEHLGRLHLRTASYANWPALVHAAAGNLLPDFPLINKSFELCYACVDR